jgi:hypothetical protein
MDDQVQKSCWGVTAWAVAGFALVLFVAMVAGGGETVALASAS